MMDSTKAAFLEKKGREMNENELKILNVVISKQCDKRGPKITTVGAQFKFKILDSIALDLMKYSALMARRNGLVLVGVDHLVSTLRHKHDDESSLECIKLLK